MLRFWGFLILLLFPLGCSDTGGTGGNPDMGVVDSALGADVYRPPFSPIGGTAFPWSTESNDVMCANQKDDDGNNYVDCDDFTCSRNIAVTACGEEAIYESSPSRCANGNDDDGDGLVDCLDPDCFKNPFHAVCEKPLSETLCGKGGDGDGDGFVDCADYDCLLGDFGCSTDKMVRVLFDQTLDETASSGPNSDWVIDSWAAFPAPSNPKSADDWHGGLSTFGYALYAKGNYLVESLFTADGRLSYDDSSNKYDLKKYDVLVIFEPSRKMGESDKTAMINFVKGGGGLLLVSNHVSADRDGNGYSAPMVFNDALDNNSVGPDPFGFRFDEVDKESARALDTIKNEDHAVIKGSDGTVKSIGFYDGCTAQLTGTNATAKGLIYLDGDSTIDQRIVVGAVEVGKGRVVFITDSAIAGDGSSSHGDIKTFHDAWNNTSQDNRVLFLNAISWLAKADSGK